LLQLGPARLLRIESLVDPRREVIERIIGRLGSAPQLVQFVLYLAALLVRSRRRVGQGFLAFRFGRGIAIGHRLGRFA
jgi:hypothetical protein